jgi:hypothetical protein
MLVNNGIAVGSLIQICSSESDEQVVAILRKMIAEYTRIKVQHALFGMEIPPIISISGTSYSKILEKLDVWVQENFSHEDAPARLVRKMNMMLEIRNKIRRCYFQALS